MRVVHLVLIVTIAAAAASCTKAQARTEPVMPVLVPPPPPPRIVEVYPEPPLGTVADTVPADSTAAALPPRVTPRPPVARPDPAKPEPPRTEPERPVTAGPALTLKPAPGTEAKTEASIRTLLQRASRDLQRVNYATLNADGRAQFDTARRFMQQAEDALRNANLSYAGKLADKAATMAATLVR